MRPLLALFGHGAMSELSPLSGVKRKLDFGVGRAAFDHPYRKPIRFRALLSNNLEPPENVTREPDILLEAEFVAANHDKANKLLIEKARSFRSGPDPAVVKAVARAHAWFEQLVSGKAQSMTQIATRENVTDNYVGNFIHLAWLSPHEVDLILEGEPEAQGWS